LLVAVDVIVDIRRDDGNSFLIVHRAGKIRYYEPVNDQFLLPIIRLI